MIDPIVITRDEAARRVGCRHGAQFVREVRRGIWPKPIAPGRWDLASLDRRVAELAGRVPASPPDEAWREELRAWQP